MTKVKDSNQLGLAEISAAPELKQIPLTLTLEKILIAVSPGVTGPLICVYNLFKKKL